MTIEEHKLHGQGCLLIRLKVECPICDTETTVIDDRLYQANVYQICGFNLHIGVQQAFVSTADAVGAEAIESAAQQRNTLDETIFFVIDKQ